MVGYEDMFLSSVGYDAACAASKLLETSTRVSPWLKEEVRTMYRFCSQASRDYPGIVSASVLTHLCNRVPPSKLVSVKAFNATQNLFYVHLH